MPIAMQRTMAMTPRIEDVTMEAWRRYTAKPNTMAIRMNMMDTMATEALVALAA